MLGIRRFGREPRWFGIASLLYVSAEAAIFAVSGIVLLRNHNDIIETPAQITNDVAKLGGPCLAVEQHQYAKYGLHKQLQRTLHEQQ